MALKDVGIRFLLTGAKDAQSGAKGITGSFTELFKTVIGFRLIEGAFDAITGFLSGATEKSFELEEALSGARRTIDGMTREELGDFKKAFMDLAPEMGKSAVELANTAQAAGQLGIAKDEILGFTEAVSKGSVALPEFSGGASEVATSISKLGNVFGIAKDGMTEFANSTLSALNALSNATAANAKQITDFAQAFTGAAVLGFEPDDVYALGAAFVSMGQDASNAGTRIQSGLSHLFGDESAMAKAAELLGITTEEFKKWASADVMGAVKALTSAIGGTAEATRGAAVAVEYRKLTEEEAAAITERYEDATKDMERADQDYERAVKDADDAVKRMTDAHRDATEVMREVEIVERDMTRATEDVAEAWDDYARMEARYREDMANTEDFEARIRIERQMQDEYERASDKERDLMRRQEDLESRREELLYKREEYLRREMEAENEYRQALDDQAYAMDGSSEAAARATEALGDLEKPVRVLKDGTEEAKTNIDKLNEANELFGQVGGRIFLTLVEGMDALIAAQGISSEGYQNQKSHLEEFGIATEQNRFKVEAYKLEWENLQTVWGDVQGEGKAILSELLMPIIEEIRGHLETLPEWIEEWKETSGAFEILYDAAWDLADQIGLLGDETGGAHDLFMKLADFLASGLTAAFKTASGLIKLFGGDWQGALDDWGEGWTGLWESLAGLMAYAWYGEGGKGGISGKWKELGEWWTSPEGWPLIKKKFDEWWESDGNVILEKAKEIGEAIGGAIIDGIFINWWFPGDDWWFEHYGGSRAGAGGYSTDMEERWWQQFDPEGRGQDYWYDYGPGGAPSEGGKYAGDWGNYGWSESAPPEPGIGAMGGGEYQSYGSSRQSALDRTRGLQSANITLRFDGFADEGSVRRGVPALMREIERHARLGGYR